MEKICDLDLGSEFRFLTGAAVGGRLANRSQCKILLSKKAIFVKSNLHYGTRESASFTANFRLKRGRAEEIVGEIRQAVRQWKQMADQYQIGRSEQELMSRAFRVAED